MNPHACYDAVFRRFRPGRLRLFYERLHVGTGTRVLDVGGSAYFWNLAQRLGLPPPRVTVLNLHPPDSGLPDFVEWTVGDGLELPFDDGQFQIVFSNSVIEHVGAWPAQQRLAAEIRRVGRAYFVQTPDRCFPIEPHVLTPFVHWLPEPLRRRLIPRFTALNLLGGLSRDEWRDLRNIRLLTRREMARLFPDGRIVRERFAGLPKSIVVYRKEPALERCGR